MLAVKSVLRALCAVQRRHGLITCSIQFIDTTIAKDREFVAWRMAPRSGPTGPPTSRRSFAPPGGVHPDRHDEEHQLAPIHVARRVVADAAPRTQNQDLLALSDDFSAQMAADLRKAERLKPGYTLTEAGQTRASEC